MSASASPAYKRANYALNKSGLGRHRLGIGSLLLARDMRAGLVIQRVCRSSRNTGLQGNRFGHLSALVRHGLAAFCAESYTLTPAGLQWLQQVEMQTACFDILDSYQEGRNDGVRAQANWAFA